MAQALGHAPGVDQRVLPAPVEEGIHGTIKVPLVVLRGKRDVAVDARGWDGSRRGEEERRGVGRDVSGEWAGR